MIISAEIKRLLTEIRRLGRETGVDPRYVADFNQLYRFYMEIEGTGPDEQLEEQDAAPRPPDQENARLGTTSPELQTPTLMRRPRRAPGMLSGWSTTCY